MSKCHNFSFCLFFYINIFLFKLLCVKREEEKVWVEKGHSEVKALEKKKSPFKTHTLTPWKFKDNKRKKVWNYYSSHVNIILLSLLRRMMTEIRKNKDENNGSTCLVCSTQQTHTHTQYHHFQVPLAGVCCCFYFLFLILFLLKLAMKNS